MGNISKFVATVSLVFAVVGCSSSPVKPSGAEPEWVAKGGGAFGGDRGRVFYGVGTAQNIGNVALLRTTADNRARNDVAKVFETFTGSLANDYMGSTSANVINQSSEEQNVRQGMKTLVNMTLSGVEIVDHWKDPETKAVYALARIDMAAFKNNISQVKDLNASVRDYIRNNADRMHDELEKELSKANSRP